MESEQAAREDLCRVGRRLCSQGLISGGEGNFCIRLDDSRLLVTPAGLSKGHMEPGDLAVVDGQGRPLDGKKASSEIRLHVRAMARRPDCRATIHAHPPTATGRALAGRGIPDDILPEAAMVLGPVALCPFGMPGTDALPDSLEEYLDTHKTFLLSSHGAFVLGSCIEDACQRMESLEQVARTILVAELLGGASPLPGPDLAVLRSEHLHGRLK